MIIKLKSKPLKASRLLLLTRQHKLFARPKLQVFPGHLSHVVHGLFEQALASFTIYNAKQHNETINSTKLQ